MAGGFLVSAFLSGDPTLSFLRSVYGSRVLVDDLAPNSGISWYFFVEMFDHFHLFFVSVANMLLWALVAPITIKYRPDPLFALTLLVGVHNIFGLYSTLGDAALYMVLWSLAYPRLSDCTCLSSLSDLRFPMVTSLLLAYAALLLPAFHYLWLHAGSANANFFYAINLVQALGMGSLVLDGAWSWGRARWEAERIALEKQNDSQTRLRMVVQR